MSDTDVEASIREEAYRLWEAEGWPDGRADLHWAAAKEIVALKDNFAGTLRRLDDTTRDPAEPTLAFENQGETPTLTDQGDGEAGPGRAAAAESVDILALGSHEIDTRETRNALRRGINSAVERLKRKRGG